MQEMLFFFKAFGFNLNAGTHAVRIPATTDKDVKAVLRVSSHPQTWSQAKRSHFCYFENAWCK
jgi:hypothetical protein